MIPTTKRFEVVSPNMPTGRFKIGLSSKMGSTSLNKLGYAYDENKWLQINKYQSFRDSSEDHGVSLIVLIRDAMERWRGGYKQFVSSSIKNPLYGTGLRSIFPVLQPVHLESYINYMIRIHDVNNDLSWMYQNHAKFFSWNNSNNLTLFEMGTLKNVNIYFLDLKDLSNPKFLEWLQERDETWNVVEKIPHANKSGPFFWENVDYFWNKYKDGRILTDKKIVCPFYDLPFNRLKPEFEILHSMVRHQQEQVDYIRKNHERYIRL